MSHHKRVPIEPNTLRDFGMGKVFKFPNNTSISGLDIDASGRYLITTSTDSYIRLYDCLDGKIKKTIECKKFGAQNVQFTHHHKTILLSSPIDHSIRYHSLHDNAYIRTFKGHKDRITSIKLCYLDDTFLTSSLDRHVRLWDLRSPQCLAICKVNGRPTISQDNEGLIFGIGTGQKELKLYDRRKFENGPFETFDSKLFPPSKHEWCDIQFSPDNKHILISTRTNLLFLIDAYNGNVIQKYSSYKNNDHEDIIGSFTPNGKYIGCGSSNGDVHFWDKLNIKNNKEEPQKVALWRGHPSSIKYFKFNPKYLTAVSAAQHVALWLPKTQTNNNKNYKSSLMKKKNNKKNVKKNNNNHNNHNLDDSLLVD